VEGENFVVCVHFTSLVIYPDFSSVPAVFRAVGEPGEGGAAPLGRAGRLEGCCCGDGRSVRAGLSSCSGRGLPSLEARAAAWHPGDQGTLSSWSFTRSWAFVSLIR
jgi:hypothetical protein